MSEILTQLQAAGQDTLVSKIRSLLNTFDPDVQGMVLQKALHHASAFLVMEITKKKEFPMELNEWAMKVAKTHTARVQNITIDGGAFWPQLAGEEPQQRTSHNNAIMAFCWDFPNVAGLIEESYLTAHEVADRLYREVRELAMPTKAA
jgi:hypothetical protein